MTEERHKQTIKVTPKEEQLTYASLPAQATPSPLHLVNGLENCQPIRCTPLQLHQVHSSLQLHQVHPSHLHSSVAPLSVFHQVHPSLYSIRCTPLSIPSDAPLSQFHQMHPSLHSVRCTPLSIPSGELFPSDAIFVLKLKSL